MPCFTRKQIVSYNKLSTFTEWTRNIFVTLKATSDIACAVFGIWYSIQGKQAFKNGFDDVTPKLISGYAGLSIVNAIVLTTKIFIWVKDYNYKMKIYKILYRVIFALSSLLTIITLSFGAVCLLLIGNQIYEIKRQEKSTENNSELPSINLAIPIAAMICIYVNVVLQVFVQGLCCHDSVSSSEESDDIERNVTNVNVDFAGNSGDINGVIELQNLAKSMKTLTPNISKEVSTMTPEPQTQDRATSPPSIEKQPVICNEMREKIFNKELMSRSRTISEDTVGTFIGGRTFPATLEITADDLDTARKRLRRNSAEADYTYLPKVLPIVFEDNEEKQIHKKSSVEKLNITIQETEVTNEAPIVHFLSSDEKQTVQKQESEVQSFSSCSEPAPLMSMKKDSITLNVNSAQDGPDDVFMPNRNFNKEIVTVEIHKEPQNNELVSSAQKFDESDTSKTSSTEEELIDKFYDKLEMLKRCGHKPLDLRMMSVQNNMNNSNLLNTPNNDAMSKQDVNSLENPPEPPISSPPNSNDTPSSIVTRFSSMKLDDTVKMDSFQDNLNFRSD